MMNKCQHSECWWINVTKCYSKLLHNYDSMHVTTFRFEQNAQNVNKLSQNFVLNNCHKRLTNCHKMLKNCHKMLTNCPKMLTNCHKMLTKCHKMLTKMSPFWSLMTIWNHHEKCIKISTNMFDIDLVICEFRLWI